MMEKLYKYFPIFLVLFVISCNGGRQKEFSFIQICDPQLGMGGYEHDVKSLRQAVEQINEMECDLVVIAGDLVHNASDTAFNRFRSIIGELDVPCYLIPGNHDVGNIPNDSTLNFYRENMGKDYYTFTHNGYAFVMVNSQLWKNHIAEESDRQNNWLVTTLDSLYEARIPLIVVGHHPMFIKLADEPEEYSNLPEEKRAGLLKLFESHDVKAYLSGHRHETLIRQYGDIQLVTGETTSKNFDKRPMGFRLWKVSADTLIHHFVPLEEF